jgi:hypothetical protein
MRSPWPVLALLVACGASESPSNEATVEVATPPSATATASASLSSAEPSAKPATEPEVLMRFKKHWSERVVPDAQDRDRKIVEAIDKTMKKGENEYRVERVSCREAQKRVGKIVTELKHDFVIHGSLTALDREGPCWSVYYAGGMKAEVEGFFTDPGLEPLAVWRIPEG